MTISSRTPEGSFNRCPVCGKVMKIVPSEPSGDANCPRCGSLVWFAVTDAGVMFFRSLHIVPGDKSEMRPRVARPPEFTPLEVDDETELPPEKVSNGDHVLIAHGYFEGCEGHIESLDELNNRVSVRINIFGRLVPVEVEVRQLKKLD